MSTAFDSGHIPEITIRHRLRIAREEAGYEQGQLAELIGVGRNTVSNAESGKTKPRKVMVNAWAMATGVPVKWLETGEAPAGTDPDGGDANTDNGLKVRSSTHLSYRGAAHDSNILDLFPQEVAA